MKIRQLVDSVVKRFVSPDPNANNKEIEELKKLGFTEIRNPSMLSEKELEELKKHPGFQPDILGQPVGRKLGHVSAFSLATFYKEEYTTALEIAEQFNELVDDEEQMAFWDKHPEVFGDASIIVFDQQQKKYFPYHGQPMGNILSGLDGPEERYEVARMYPAHVSSFDLFMEWCTKKCPYWNNYKVITEAYYWEQMKAYAEFDNGFEKDFLIKELSGAEEYRDGIKEPFNILGYNYCPDEIAEQHFLFYGNQDGSGVLPGVFDSSFNLFTVYNKLITCPLSHYGSIFSKYFHGFQAAQMVAFLRKQKKRLDKDEDIRYLDSQVMASSITNMQSQGVVQDSSGHNPIDSSPGDKSMVASPIIYIEPDKRPDIERQLGFHLDTVNKKLLSELLDLKPPQQRIDIQIDAKILADYFRQVYGAKHIDNRSYKKQDVGEWLAYWFVTNGKSARPQTFNDFLQMKDNNPKLSPDKMSGRIRYKK